MSQTSPPLTAGQPGLRLETGIRLSGLLFAVLVVVATLAHVWSLERAIETEAQGRARTLSRILASEVNRTLGSIQGSIDLIDDGLLVALQRADLPGVQGLLENAAQGNPLIRELALVDDDGRMLASSRRRAKPVSVAGYDFLAQPRDGRYRLGLATEGRSLGADGGPRQGAAFARQGFLTLSRSLNAPSGAVRVVAVLGSDSLMNALRFLAADDDEVLSVYRYDGQLLAASAAQVMQRTAPQPIFARFIPERENGQFTDTLADGSDWLAHFDTTADFPAVVEVRIARASLVARRVRELSVPLLVMSAVLLAVLLYTRFALGVMARRRASEELAATQSQRLRNILDNAADGIITIDERGIVRDFNQAAERIFGVQAEDTIGKPLADLMPPADGRQHQGHVLRYLAQGGGSVIGQGRVLQVTRPDGRPLEVHLAVSEVIDQGERLFTGIVRDITASRAMERELARHRGHLEEMVADRTVELQAAQIESERLSRVKGDFLAKMSHEIRTPLNAVLGLAQIGARGASSGSPVDTFRRIADAGQHLMAVINDILDVSRLEAGRLSLEIRPFQLAGMTERLSRLFAPDAQARGLSWSVKLAPDLPSWVEGDESRVSQVLTNLVANALKFTETGAVTLRIDREDDLVTFRVIDTGIGIAPEQLPRLFTPFEQIDNTVTRKYGGSGLGLAISRDLARLMGGGLQADSRLGQGSVFTLRIPLPAVAAPRTLAREESLQGGRLAGLRLLAAEDVAVNRLVLEGLLEHEGATVTFAENGLIALQRLESVGAAAFDAVLMDIQMPVMDGYEATRRIRAMTDTLPIIGVTAHAMADERDRCLAAGMVAHIAKPIDVDELVATVMRHTSAPGLARVPPEPEMQKPPADMSPGDGHEAIDWDGLQARLNGNRAMVRRLASVLLTGYLELPVEMRDAIATNDAVQVRFLAHKLKSVFAELGLRRASEQAALAEAAGRSQDPGAGQRLAGLLPQVESVFEQARCYLDTDTSVADR